MKCFTSVCSCFREIPKVLKKVSLSLKKMFKRNKVHPFATDEAEVSAEERQVQKEELFCCPKTNRKLTMACKRYDAFPNHVVSVQCLDEAGESDNENESSISFSVKSWDTECGDNCSTKFDLELKSQASNYEQSPVPTFLDDPSWINLFPYVPVNPMDCSSIKMGHIILKIRTNIKGLLTKSGDLHDQHSEAVSQLRKLQKIISSMSSPSKQSASSWDELAIGLQGALFPSYRQDERRIRKILVIILQHWAWISDQLEQPEPVSKRVFSQARRYMAIEQRRSFFIRRDFQ